MLLNSIERMYGSVTEYNRCMEEKQARKDQEEWEQSERFAKLYSESREMHCKMYRKLGWRELNYNLSEQNLASECSDCELRSRIFSVNLYKKQYIFFCPDHECGVVRTCAREELTEDDLPF